jgi:hypothetical protein
MMMNKKRILFHLLGLSSIAEAVSVAVIIFFSITVRGYCLTVEYNLAIRWFETALACYAVV